MTSRNESDKPESTPAASSKPATKKPATKKPSVKKPAGTKKPSQPKAKPTTNANTKAKPATKPAKPKASKPKVAQPQTEATAATPSKSTGPRLSIFDAAAEVRQSAKRAIDTAREAAEQAKFVASEAAREMASMASETARSAAEIANDRARTALQRASKGAQMVAQLAEDGAKVTAQLASETAKAAGQMARDVAMQMAQAYLRKTTIKLPLPEALINKQLKGLAERHPSVDFLAVYCGDDRLTVAIDGHHNRLIYTVELLFDVLECRVSRNAQYLRVRQVGENLDAQFRQSNLVTNWLTRQAGRGAFFVANRMPTKSPVKQILADIPGFEMEASRLWRINLQETDIAELFADRRWMADKLTNLNEFASLPGLSTLRDSRELLMQLVNQFEIRDMRVRPGRLELRVGIASLEAPPNG